MRVDGGSRPAIDVEVGDEVLEAMHAGTESTVRDGDPLIVNQKAVVEA